MHRKEGSVLSTVLAAFSLVAVSECLLTLPEFAEPIKNVTLPLGSDVEFSCDVRHLGTYRVTWSWKNDQEQKFLAIGIVKITRNLRVHISRIQKSDDVTQFNLYIYNLKKGDEGVYFCSVNSNPMIEQIGTLEISGDKSLDENNGKINGQHLHNGKNTIPLLTVDSSSSNSSDSNLNISPSQNSSEHLNKNTSFSSTSSDNDISVSEQGTSSLLCIDFGEMWENARERISAFLSTLLKYTYSYWFS